MSQQFLRRINMVNIWDYANALPCIELLTTFGEKYVGGVLTVLDAEETEDTQDCIDIRLDSGAIKSFYPDEIESIKVLSED